MSYLCTLTSSTLSNLYSVKRYFFLCSSLIIVITCNAVLIFLQYIFKAINTCIRPPVIGSIQETTKTESGLFPFFEKEVIKDVETTLYLAEGFCIST